MKNEKNINWDYVERLAEKALDASCLEIQTKLGITDGFNASIFFSDDKVIDTFKSYILSEIAETAPNAWKISLDTEVEDISRCRILRDAFLSCMIPVYESNKYYAIINSNLMCCPFDQQGLPDLDSISKACGKDQYELDFVNKRFGTDFKEEL